EQPVSQEQLKTIIEAAVRAPNASNRQSYSIIAVTNQDKIKRHIGFKAPLALIFCVDYTRVIDTAHFLDENFEVNGVLSFIHGSVDACLAAQNAALAATSLGLGQMFTNGLHRRPLEDLFQAFNIPEKYCFPLIALLIGYPDREHSKKKGRLKDLGILHQEAHQRLDEKQLAELVTYIDNPANNMAVAVNVPPDIDSYLRWYFRNWPNKSSREKQEEFLERLKKSGFAL
ncbi:MAG TPA: hypothetical protein GX697_04270, partial [Firmicutes bacterium]|nr:hypothetical protein [Bacillota bacterium]